MHPEPIEEVIETYKSLVYGIALTQTGHRFDADEVFQDVFLAYHRKEKIFRDAEHQKAWLIRVTLNYCKKIHRHSWNRRTVGIKEHHQGTVAFQLPEENGVFSALSELPDKYRTVLYLFYFQSYTTDEISSLLKIRGGTVRMRLTRGRELMRQKLEGGDARE